jgi:signal transduction histidine kinase
MSEFAITLLLGISSFLGIQSVPEGTDNWQIIQNWHLENGYLHFQAESKTIASECEKHPESIIEFPQIIHGVHKIYSNGQLLKESGDSSFTKASPFYYAPVLACKNINPNEIISWEVISYTNYFARFNYFPRLSNTSLLSFFKDLEIFLLLSGFITALSLISLIIYTDKKSIPAIKHNFVGAFCFAIYMFSCVNSQLHLNLSMLTMHKMADSFFWISIALIFYFFFKNSLLDKIFFKTHLTFSVLSFLIIVAGTTGDEVQLGTSLPFISTLACFTVISFSTFKQYLDFGKSIKNVFIFIGTLSVIILGINDMMVIFGLINSALFFPFGMSILVLTTALSINVEIKDTYKQRDELLHSLEEKVSEKTKNLVEALETVQRSQAELVETSRLASLGTLSAGIAHEINNAINFIHGAIVPLERKVTKAIPESDKESVKKLFNVIKDGTQLTIDIVQSLRTYTGLNQSEMKDVKIKTIVDSVVTILKSKLRDCDMKIDIPEDLTYCGHHVGLNQIIMNLITNAIDALPEVNRAITIRAEKQNNELILTVKDNGKGIPDNIKARIFDPFYTTKDVGKGTGLGLHIVKKEVERHNGTIELSSKINEGTTFILHLPDQALEVAA